MKKEQKIELEILAIKLWFQNFYYTKLCTEAESNYMSKKLNELKNKLSLLKIKNF
jgi:hypothetical protein